MFESEGDETVTCIACGTTLPRSRAREYDKLGNRWEREQKSFEYLCKPCDRDRDRQPRSGLEALLTECGAGERPRDSFLAAYFERVENESDVRE